MHEYSEPGASDPRKGQWPSPESLKKFHNEKSSSDATEPWRQRTNQDESWDSAAEKLQALTASELRQIVEVQRARRQSISDTYDYLKSTD